MVSCGSAGERCNSRSNGSASTRRRTHRSPPAGPTSAGLRRQFPVRRPSLPAARVGTAGPPSTRGGAAAALPGAAPSGKPSIDLRRGLTAGKAQFEHRRPSSREQDLALSNNF